MNRFPKIFALLAPLALPVMAQAHGASLIGDWCAQDSRGAIYFENESIGMNEHTICELEEPVGDVTTFKAELTCFNAYLSDGEIVRAFEMTVPFEAVLETDNLMRVLMDDDPEPLLYERCE